MTPPRPVLLVLLAATATLATGCAGTGDAGTASASSATSTPSGTWSPVTLEHRYGTTTVDAEPQRVVSVGFNDHDTLLALGVTPVGVRDWYGDQPSATWPWAQDELAGAEPVVLPSAELDLEAVAALEPDLIVGIFSGMTQQEYDVLSQIAPTVASSAEHSEFGTPWREVTQTLGTVLGRSEQADEVVAEVDADLEAARAANPGLDGATATVTFYSAGTLGAYTSTDLRSRLLEELGLDVPAEVDEVAGEGAFYAPVSLEDASLVDRDVLVWITATPQEVEEVRALPVRQTLSAADQGREVFLPFELNGAMSFSSPLSIPYVLQQLPAELSAAVDGDPATAVPSAQG